MKNLFFTLVFLLIGTFTFSSNISLNLMFANCYEVAFDAMDEAANAGLSPSDISIVGERAYCECQPNCQWNPQ